MIPKKLLYRVVLKMFVAKLLSSHIWFFDEREIGEQPRRLSTDEVFAAVDEFSEAL